MCIHIYIYIYIHIHICYIYIYIYVLYTHSIHIISLISHIIEIIQYLGRLGHLALGARVRGLEVVLHSLARGESLQAVLKLEAPVSLPLPLLWQEKGKIMFVLCWLFWAYLCVVLFFRKRIEEALIRSPARRCRRALPPASRSTASSRPRSPREKGEIPGPAHGSEEGLDAIDHPINGYACVSAVEAAPALFPNLLFTSCKSCFVACLFCL